MPNRTGLIVLLVVAVGLGAVLWPRISGKVNGPTIDAQALRTDACWMLTYATFAKPEATPNPTPVPTPNAPKPGGSPGRSTSEPGKVGGLFASIHQAVYRHEPSDEPTPLEHAVGITLTSGGGCSPNGCEATTHDTWQGQKRSDKPTQTLVVSPYATLPKNDLSRYTSYQKQRPRGFLSRLAWAARTRQDAWRRRRLSTRSRVRPRGRRRPVYRRPTPPLWGPSHPPTPPSRFK